MTFLPTFLQTQSPASLGKYVAVPAVEPVVDQPEGTVVMSSERVPLFDHTLSAEESEELMGYLGARSLRIPLVLRLL